MSQTEPDAVAADEQAADEQAADEQAADEPAVEEGRPRRRRWILALTALVVAVLVVTGAIVVSVRNGDAPVDAVREYVDAIARGDARTANALADPTSFGAGVDPALLTEVLGSAKERITVEEVDLGYDADLEADVVEVDVSYRLSDTAESSVVLRAKRAGTTAGLLDEWRVIDPLLVPVSVETNEPRLDTASLGAGTVPVGGPGVSDFPERRFYVYPGSYELRGHESRYLEAAPETIVATNSGYGERLADTDAQVVETQLSYRATADLTSTVTDRLTDHLATCFAAVPNVPRGCPWTVWAYADFAKDMRLQRQPEQPSIAAYQVDYRRDGRIEPVLRFRAENGWFSYINEEGERRTKLFTATGWIVVTPDDDLTVTFTTD